MRKKLVARLGTALLHTTLLCAQTGQTTVLSGTARNASGAPLGEAIRLDATLEAGLAPETTTSLVAAGPSPAISEHLTSAFLASTPIAARFREPPSIRRRGLPPRTSRRRRR